jgi:O-antigen/teichoic acid export membrane protein
MNFTQKGFIALSGKFLGAFLNLITTIFLARYLGVGGIGQYQLILSTQVVIITVFSMGFGNASVYFINSQKINKSIIVSSLFKVVSLISIIVVFILILSMLFFKKYFGSLSITSITCFSIGAGFLLMYNTLMPVLYASLEILKLQIIGLISTILLLIAFTLFYFLGSLNVELGIVIVGMVNIVTTVILLFVLRKDINIGLKVNYKVIYDLFSYGVKVSASNLVFILSTNVVIFLLKFLLQDGFEAVGLYSRASAVAGIFILLPATLGPMFYSKWCGVLKGNLHGEIEKTLRVLIFLSFLCAFGTFFFGGQLLLILYGKEFIAAKSALNLLSVSIVFSSISIVLTDMFSSIGKPTVTLKVFVCSLVLTTLFCCILIPFYNINGAAIAVLIGIICNASMLLYLSKKEINLSWEDSLVIKKEDFVLVWQALKLKNTL